MDIVNDSQFTMIIIHDGHLCVQNPQIFSKQ